MEPMEKGERTMTRKAYYARKIKRATQLLYYKRHMKPGVKGWELKNALGSDYPKILKVLDGHLEKLDLQVKIDTKDITKASYYNIEDGTETSLVTSESNGITTFTVPRLDVWGIVVLETK